MVRRLWPNTLLYQILVLMAFASLFMILVGAAALHFVRLAFERNPTIMNGHLVSVAIARLNDTPVDRRQAVLDDIRRDAPQLDIELLPEDALKSLPAHDDAERSGPFQIGDTLFGMRIEHVTGPGEDWPGSRPIVYVKLRDGGLLAADWGFRHPPPSIIGLPFYLFFGFLALTFFGLMIWAAKGLVRPLSELAASAKAFGESSTNPVPIVEHGPREVRVAAQAFNRMQLRINDFLEKRTRMLAAVSHDLRTPLTRLRLRLDLLEEGDVRDRSLEDLNIMENQIDAALTFLRDGASSEPVHRIDVPSLLQSLANQYADLGFSIAVSCDGKFAIKARSGELQRALSNLIDNALHYACGVEIEACSDGECVTIDIIDHGPGIPQDERARLLEPFERGDHARQVREGTGFGLGLATGRTIVEAASGTLELCETAGGGLTVRLRFPAV